MAHGRARQKSHGELERYVIRKNPLLLPNASTIAPASAGERPTCTQAHDVLRLPQSGSHHEDQQQNATEQQYLSVSSLKMPSMASATASNAALNASWRFWRTSWNATTASLAVLRAALSASSSLRSRSCR